MVKTLTEAGEPMRIESLLQGIERGTLKFRGITHDSRKVEEGYVFVALSGSSKDGHDLSKKRQKKGQPLWFVSGK
jgi:UDP-N-acetylmuramoyl-L-alanyl-D-glutamate--2,6-diaminopimelate ligase